MGSIVEVVRAFVPSERWPELQAALRRDEPVGAPSAQGAAGIQMVEIDDGSEEDGY
jgi:hypothetical protein